MLTSHCNNLSAHHYYLTYHPCLATQFCHGQTMQQYFRADTDHVFKKKGKAIELLFCAKENSKKKNDIDKDWADKLAASDKGSYYSQHEFDEVVLGNCVAVILWLYSSVQII